MSKISAKIYSFLYIAYGILMGMKGGLQGRFRVIRAYKPELKTSGFTIIETLIVLAVSGALFVATAVTLSGRQQRTQFEQSIQEVRSQIQQTINEVATGYYPNMNNFSCTAGASGPVFGAGSTEQGANKGCVFLGKVIQFKMAGTDPEEMRVFSVAGLQKNSAGNEVTTYTEAMPKIVSYPDATSASDRKQLLYGLTTNEVYYGAVKTNIGAIAFVNSLAQYSSGSIVSGAQQVNLIPINQTFLDATVSGSVSAIENRFTTSPVNPANGAHICFVSGATNQSGLITIGSNGRQLSVTLSIKGNRTCA